MKILHRSNCLRRCLRNFLIPKFTRHFLLRLAVVALSSFVFFRYVCQPVVIRGGSMMPTYPERGLNFCWHPAFWFSSPERGDVVIMEYGSSKVLILKRLVALEGDSVEFRDGILFLNGKAVEEPYLRHRGHWTLPPRIVEKDHFYLVGDNRMMDIDDQIFGQMHRKYLTGKPLW